MCGVCTICGHERRGEIERSLLVNLPLRTIAAQWGVSKTALIRHKDHIAGILVKASEKQEDARADRLLEQLLDLQNRTMEHLAEAEQDGDRRTRLGAIREARSNLELIGRYLGEIGGGEVNVNLVSLSIDEATDRKLAETYLGRHGANLVEAGSSK